MKRYLNNNRVRNVYAKGQGPPVAQLTAAFRLVISPAAALTLGDLTEVTVAYDDNCDNNEKQLLYLSDQQVQNVKPYKLTPMYGSSGRIITMAGLKQELGPEVAQRFVGHYTVEHGQTRADGSGGVWILRQVGQAVAPELLGREGDQPC